MHGVTRGVTSYVGVWRKGAEKRGSECVVVYVCVVHACNRYISPVCVLIVITVLLF